MVKNSPANIRDMGSEPWSGEIPPTSEQLSPHATTTEPMLRSKRSHSNEKSVGTTRKRSPYLPEDPMQPKINSFFKKKNHKGPGHREVYTIF